ncbi:MAG: ribonuclease III [Caenispirillum bisanense]|nr:ribonuclease III [Caenispirillum bisanense]MCA1974184.1 ribonuclease III [Caenispirillum sp.]
MAASATTPDRARLEAALGHTFGNPRLLAEALAHRSGGGPFPVGYERLEFLGDRVLGLIVADMLLARYPTEAEGQLARRHAALVRKEALVVVADGLDLGAHVTLSRGEEEAGSRNSASLKADICEAVIGALYLDGGIDAARRFVERRFTPLMEAELKPPKDAKTALQEWAQGQGKPLPVYRTVETVGPAHEPHFVVEVAVDGVAPATGTGTSKRKAEQMAAEALLDKVTKTA